MFSKSNINAKFSIRALLLLLLVVAVFFGGVQYGREQLRRSEAEKERAAESRMIQMVGQGPGRSR